MRLNWQIFHNFKIKLKIATTRRDGILGNRRVRLLCKAMFSLKYFLQHQHSFLSKGHWTAQVTYGNVNLAFLDLITGKRRVSGHRNIHRPSDRIIRTNKRPKFAYHLQHVLVLVFVTLIPAVTYSLFSRGVFKATV